MTPRAGKSGYVSTGRFEMTEPRINRLWWPAEWTDGEYWPPGRRSPDDFIKCPSQGQGYVWIGYDLDADGVSEHTKRFYQRRVKRGALMDFIRRDDLGIVDVMIRANGTYSVTGKVPPEATDFWEVGEPESWAGSFNEFVRNWAECEFAMSDEQEVVVRVAMMSTSEPIPHRLTVKFGENPDVLMSTRVCFEPIVAEQVV